MVELTIRQLGTSPLAPDWRRLCVLQMIFPHRICWGMARCTNTTVWRLKPGPQLPACVSLDLALTIVSVARSVLHELGPGCLPCFLSFPSVFLFQAQQSLFLSQIHWARGTDWPLCTGLHHVEQIKIKIPLCQHGPTYSPNDCSCQTHAAGFSKWKHSTHS